MEEERRVIREEGGIKRQVPTVVKIHLVLFVNRSRSILSLLTVAGRRTKFTVAARRTNFVCATRNTTVYLRQS